MIFFDNPLYLHPNYFNYKLINHEGRLFRSEYGAAKS